MNWYKTSSSPRRFAEPEELGYNPSWGEHHGPVEFQPDTWNYGAKGYPSSSGPMPLPKKLYHVTPFPEAIMQEGFKNFTEADKQTFGGHGEYVSFTSLENAKLYHEALKDIASIARGEHKYDEETIKNFAQKWNLRKDTLDSKIQMIDSWSKHDYKNDPSFDDRAKLIEFLNSSGNFPYFLGSGKTLVLKFEKLSPDSIAILEADINDPMEWHNNVNSQCGI